MTKKQQKVLWRIIATAVLVAVVKLFSIGGVAGTVLYLAAYLIIGYDILRKAFRGIIKGQVFDENFLMAVATVGAIALAVYEKSGDYLEAVAVMLFYQIGELFQSYAVGKSRRSITALMDIRPDYANIEQDGKLVQVDPDDVAVGSIIVVQPGEKVPLDGVVTEGSSTLNTAALTGESLPRDAAAGDEVISGCVNMTGVLKIRTTKAFANEEKQQTRFDGANEIFKTAKRGFHKEMGLFNASMEFFICILSVVVIAVGGWLIMKGQMDYVGLITFSLYITTFISPIRKLANFAEMFSNGFAGLHRFIELMATEPTIQDAPDAVELSQVRGEVELDHVSFTYPGSSEVLHDIDLTVAAGETVAIVGPSGGGKSTLCQLVPRFYDVTEGSIRVDGLDVRQVTQRSLRRAIGIVQQDVFLFADTIRENIRYGRPDATDEEVEQAAHRAELLEDIRTMPQGFDTYVGERGAMLSGGQKQRVAIARIFLKDPAILILDEATSALDSVTEAKIQGAFDQLSQGRTTLIIAHRLSTIRSAHRILVVQDGRIAEQGSHAQLLAENGAYARLYHTQNLGESHG